LALAISQKAQSHLSKPIALSSKIVPTRIVNCFRVLHRLQVQSLRVEIKLTSLQPQRGQETLPLDQRIDFIKSNALPLSAKYLTAS